MKIKELLEGEVKKQLYGKVATLPIMKPAIKKSRTETQLENIAKKANQPLTDVKNSMMRFIMMLNQLSHSTMP